MSKKNFLSIEEASNKYYTKSEVDKKTTDTVDTPTRLIGNVDYITSPNGTKYKVSVDDSCNLLATQIV